MNRQTELSPMTLSLHLFWDTDPSKLDARRHRRLIIRRVLQYGTLNDWERIRQFYGLDEIARVAMPIADLDVKSAAFVALLANIPGERFACFATRPATTKHWVS